MLAKTFEIFKNKVVNLFVNAFILGYRAHFGLSYIYLVFFLHLITTFSWEIWKCCNLLKMKTGQVKIHVKCDKEDSRGKGPLVDYN
jgi:hypothetical protein